MLPALKNEILNSGACVDVFFLTSGDASDVNAYYAQGREYGAMANWLVLTGAEGPPIANPVSKYSLVSSSIGNHNILRYTQNYNPNISLNFLRAIE